MFTFIISLVVVLILGILLVADQYVVTTCTDTDGSKTIIKGFTFSKKYKALINEFFNRKDERLAKEIEEYEAKAKALELKIYSEKMKSEYKPVKLTGDIEKDKIIKTYNDLRFKYLNNSRLDLKYFNWLMGSAKADMTRELEKLERNRENHELIMMFHVN